MSSVKLNRTIRLPVQFDWTHHVADASKVYCYVDSTSDGSPFYVGKGNVHRVLLVRARNIKHLHVANKHGIKRTVVESVPLANDEDVLRREVELIRDLQTFHTDSELGCNFTRGGDGVIGRVPWNKGKRMDVEYRRIHQMVTPKTRVSQHDIDGNFIAVYESLWAAKVATGISSSSNILGCCKGDRKTAGGFIWKYA
jgi:hypothetical protein